MVNIGRSAKDAAPVMPVRRSLLALSLSLAVASASEAPAASSADDAAQRSMWIVRFAEPALASYTGV